MPALKIAIVGGGVGGLSAAIALHRHGHDVTVFEQAASYSRVGADINLTPNVVRAIDGLGAGAAIRARGARPTFRISRDWDSGQETSRLPMGDVAEQRYGAPQVTIHRADIIEALAEQFPAGHIRFGQRIRTLAQDDAGVTLQFEDGSAQRFDVVVGADGIHSRVRTALFGEEQPRFTGVVSFRSVVPTERVQHVPEIEAFTKMGNVSEDVLRIIATNRAWVKNYNVVAGLTRNPKTPTALAMGFLQRLNERDLKMIAIDRNVSEPVRLAARKSVSKTR